MAADVDAETKEELETRDKTLPLSVYMYNTKKRTSTSKTPYGLVHGRERSTWIDQSLDTHAHDTAGRETRK